LPSEGGQGLWRAVAGFILFLEMGGGPLIFLCVMFDDVLLTCIALAIVIIVALYAYVRWCDRQDAKKDRREGAHRQLFSRWW
jgi:membrane protein implicated in regulation of membrane protease activity